MARTIKIGSYSYTLPDWAPARIAIGVLLIICGFLGFLPVLGFWMIPLGIAILAYDIARVRLLRQKVMAWWRHRGNGAGV
jgi:voltage-gated potassium channel Kch